MGGLVGHGDPADLLINAGRAAIGTPDDAIAMIEKLKGKQGEFGVLLLQAHNWAEWDQTKKSYELYARFVMPHFAGVNRNRIDSYDRLRQDFEVLQEERQKGVDLAFAKWSERDRSKRPP
jgi:limonene 1,2-monooxygenase